MSRFSPPPGKCPAGPIAAVRRRRSTCRGRASCGDTDSRASGRRPEAGRASCAWRPRSFLRPSGGRCRRNARRFDSQAKNMLAQLLRRHIELHGHGLAVARESHVARLDQAALPCAVMVIGCGALACEQLDGDRAVLHLRALQRPFHREVLTRKDACGGTWNSTTLAWLVGLFPSRRRSCKWECAIRGPDRGPHRPARRR